MNVLFTAFLKLLFLMFLWIVFFTLWLAIALNIVETLRRRHPEKDYETVLAPLSVTLAAAIVLGIATLII